MIKKTTITFLFLLSLCIGYSFAYAAEVNVQLQIPVGTTKSITVCRPTGSFLSCNGIAEYISAIYRWAIGFAAVLAVLALTWGGIQWLTAGGESGKTQEAQKVIGNAIIGLLLALGSYTMLYAINPRLTQYDPLSIRRIEPVDLKLATLIASHDGVRERFNSSPGTPVSGFAHVTFDADSKKDMESAGVLTQLLVDLLKNVDIQGFAVKVSTLSSGHNAGTYHNPGGRAADIVGTQDELARLATYLKSNQASLHVNELYYAFNADAAVEECIPQNSSYLNSAKHADLKKDHEDHLHVAVGCGRDSFEKTSTPPVAP